MINKYLNMLYENERLLYEQIIVNEVIQPLLYQLPYFLVNKKNLPKNFKRTRNIRRPSKYLKSIGRFNLIDSEIKESWLKKLNTNKSKEVIKYLMTCQGHSKYELTHIFLNVKKNSINYKIKDILNKVPNTKCDYFVFTEEFIQQFNKKYGMKGYGVYIFENREIWMCTSPFWYGDGNEKRWSQWWEDITSVFSKIKM